MILLLVIVVEDRIKRTPPLTAFAAHLVDGAARAVVFLDERREQALQRGHLTIEFFG